MQIDIWSDLKAGSASNHHVGATARAVPLLLAQHSGAMCNAVSQTRPQLTSTLFDFSRSGRVNQAILRGLPQAAAARTPLGASAAHLAAVACASPPCSAGQPFLPVLMST